MKLSFQSALSRLGLLLVLAACGSSTTAGPVVPEDAVDLTGQTTVTVAVGDNNYTERKIVVSPGTEVIWVNEGLNRHNVIASEKDAFETIPTADLDDGGSGARAFDEPGEYAYYCSIHGNVNNGQRGWVYVAAE